LIQKIGQLTVDINWLEKRYYDTTGPTHETIRSVRRFREYISLVQAIGDRMQYGELYPLENEWHGH
jgi:hypothetical protein